MNSYLRGFRLVSWIGVLVNLVGFVLPALLAPDLLETILGPGAVELSYVWVASAGMLLLIATLFYIPAAKRPLHYLVYAWLAVIGRLLAATFWIWTNLRWQLPGPVRTFFIADLGFGIVLFFLLHRGMPVEHKISVGSLSRAVTAWRWQPAANRAVAAFRILVCLSVLLSVAFVAAAFLSPAWLTSRLAGSTVTFTYLWLGNCGMLLVQLTLFVMQTVRDPVRYAVYAWLTVAGHCSAAALWLAQNARWDLDGPVAWLWLPAGLLGLGQGLALQRALPAESRLTVANILAWLEERTRDVGRAFPTAAARVGALVVLVALGTIGAGLYANLARAKPDTVFADAAEQFKYGAIGLGQAYRLPLYLWNVLPTVCSDLLPNGGKGGWASLGLIYEPGHDLPIGFARREIGYPSLEPNCALCHTTTYRTAEGAPQQVILGGPAHVLDLQAFQWFLYDCAASEAFNAPNLLAEIEKTEDLGWFEKQVYRFAIVPFAKSGLLVQRRAYAWQKSRPPQGRGRTDTFNPTKIVVFHMADDGTIGTVDLPAIWNQRAREGMYLHWDGNNNAITERNYAAAMAVGASPYSVLEQNFKRVTDFVLDLAPPAYPFPIDNQAAERGYPLYQTHCAGCHAFGNQKVGTVTGIEEIGTDRHRLDSFTARLVESFHTIDERPFVFDAYRKTGGYSNLPIDGTWARAPYLHNGSVATLWDLLTPPTQRTPRFLRGSDVYDTQHMGFVAGPPTMGGNAFLLDTSVPGNGNEGHDYGTELSEEEKRDLIEYLKTL